MRVVNKVKIEVVRAFFIYLFFVFVRANGYFFYLQVLFGISVVK